MSVQLGLILKLGFSSWGSRASQATGHGRFRGARHCLDHAGVERDSIADKADIRDVNKDGGGIIVNTTFFIDHASPSPPLHRPGALLLHPSCVHLAPAPPLHRPGALRVGVGHVRLIMDKANGGAEGQGRVYSRA